MQDFPFGDPNNLQYLRENRFRFGDWKTPEATPYYLASSDQGKEPNELLTEAIEQYVPGARDLTPEEWDEVKRTATADGSPLTDFGFQNLLLRAKGVEVHDAIVDAGGYYTLFGDWNAAEAMAYLLSDFPGSPTYKRLAKGFQALPEKLARLFKQAGGMLMSQHRLRLLEQTQVSGEPVIRLTFNDAEGNAAPAYYARHVVLAMPRRSIELLDQDSFLFGDQQFLSDLQSVTPQSAAKIFLAYDRPWWRDIGLKNGRSDTDLPMRQCYYWGTEGDEPDADPDNQNSLLLASYHDGIGTRFWSGFLNTPPYLGTLATAPEPEVPSEPEYAQLPHLMLAELQRHLQELQGTGCEHT